MTTPLITRLRNLLLSASVRCTPTPFSSARTLGTGDLSPHKFVPMSGVHHPATTLTERSREAHA